MSGYIDLDQHPVAASSALAESVPVIAIGGLIDGSSAEAEAVITAIARACREWGFFQIIDHGVPETLIEQVWRQTRAFFALPQASKERILRTRENPWGYYHNELTKNQRDKKEVFDFTAEGVDPIYSAENRWPDMDDAFRPVMLAWYQACTALSLKLLEAFCVGLDLPGDHLHDRFVATHTGFVRLNHYPVKDPLADSALPHLPTADRGVHHHTDAGALTILLQDEIGGLQVYKDGAWRDINPVTGAFVVNTGDMMQVWSNDRYRAAIHRVLAMDSADRISIPFFFNPAADTEVIPLATVVSPDDPPHYEPIVWAEFRGKRTDGDYADYGTEVQISHYRRG